MGNWLIFLALLFATITFGLTAVAPGLIRPPAAVAVEDENLVVRLRGPYKLFAVRSSVTVPLASIQSVRVEPHARKLRRGIRFGTYVPGGTIAGSFGRGSSKAFWAVQGDVALVIELAAGQPYAQLVIEVREPEAAMRLINDARS